MTGRFRKNREVFGFAKLRRHRFPLSGATRPEFTPGRRFFRLTGSRFEPFCVMMRGSEFAAAVANRDPLAKPLTLVPGYEDIAS